MLAAAAAKEQYDKEQVVPAVVEHGFASFLRFLGSPPPFPPPLSSPVTPTAEQRETFFLWNPCVLHALALSLVREHSDPNSGRGASTL